MNHLIKSLIAPETGTLKDLNVNVGDTLRWVTANGVLKIQKNYNSMFENVVFTGRLDGGVSFVNEFGDTDGFSKNTPHIFAVKKRAENDNSKPWINLTNEEKGALLLANHQGETIQILNDIVWEDIFGAPLWTDNKCFRVKPEPVVMTRSLFFGDSIHVVATVNTVDGKLDKSSLTWQD